MVSDKIERAFFDMQYKDARGLADASDLLDLQRFGPQHFAARFNSKVLVCGTDGEVSEQLGFEVGYFFQEGYLRHVDPLRVITWIRPSDFFHPNARVPVCCIGHISPGTPLVDLIFRTYEMASCQTVMPDERDALNPIACQWARNHQERFPLDTRPLKRRSREAQRAALELSTSPDPLR